MSTWLKHNRLILVGVGIGAVAGWSYWYWIGCATGSCAITAHPVNSTVYGAIMGGLTFNLFDQKKQENH